MRTKVVPLLDVMDEVIHLENQIRAGLKAKKNWPDDLLSDAKAIMAGRPTKITGSRLERLQKIAAEFSAK